MEDSTVLKPQGEKREFGKKFIDFTKTTFPETNPIDMRQNEEGQEEIIFANYRYPCQTERRKGIIFFLHGFGEYCARYAYFCKIFAEQGYDVVGMDQKGNGNSGGQVGYIESKKALIDEFFQYFDLVEKEYGGKDVKKFIMGYSMGGLNSVILSIRRPGFFDGIALLAPCFGFLHEELIKPFRPLLEKFNMKDPTHRLIPLPEQGPSPPKHLVPWYIDPMQDSDFIQVRTFMVFESLFKELTDENIAELLTPIIMILGEKENLVNNALSKKVFDKCPAKVKDLISIKELDHMLMHDAELLHLVTQPIIRMFDKLSL